MLLKLPFDRFEQRESRISWSADSLRSPLLCRTLTNQTADPFIGGRVLNYSVRYFSLFPETTNFD